MGGVLQRAGANDSRAAYHDAIDDYLVYTACGYCVKHVLHLRYPGKRIADASHWWLWKLIGDAESNQWWQALLMPQTTARAGGLVCRQNYRCTSC